MRDYLAFDIETAKILPADAGNILEHRPLGIACAATARRVGDSIAVRTWQGTPQMSKQACIWLVDDLERAVDGGATLLTHNGAGFDLDILAEESGEYARCASLALNSVDSCFHVHCVKGFPVGLDAICQGMGIEGKTEGVSGALAPQLWADGRHDEVLAYVAQDAKVTLVMAMIAERRMGIMWIARSGAVKYLSFPRWLTVQEAMALPEPDTGWMDNPIPRSRFVEWMNGGGRNAR